MTIQTSRLQRLLVVVSVMFGLAVNACAGALPSRGLAQFNSGDYFGAVRSLTQECARNPSDTGLRLSLAVALLQVKDFERARAALDRVIQMAPGAEIVRTLRASAVSSQDNSAKRTASNPGAPRYTFAPADGSIAALTLAAMAHPDSAAVANLLGDAYQMAPNTAKAEEWYSKATALAPAWSKPRIGLALALLDTEPARAASLLEQVLTSEPSNAQARLWLGDAYAALGRREEAIAAYRLADKDLQTRSDALVRLGTILLRKDRLSEAEQIFQDALRDDPSNPAAQAGTAQVLALQKKPDRALQAMEQAQTASQTASPQRQSAVLSNLAIVAANKGDYGEGERYFEAAIRIDPDRQSIYRQMAEMYRQAGTLDQNNRLRENWLKSKPNDTRSLRYLVEGYELSGNTVEEIRVLQVLIESLAAKDRSSLRSVKTRLAGLYWGDGQKHKAFQTWLSAVDTGYPTWTVAIAQSILALDGAAPYVEEHLISLRSSREACHLSFAISMRQGHFDAALKALDDVISRDPENSTLYGQKSFLLRSMGRPEEADDLERAHMPAKVKDESGLSK